MTTAEWRNLLGPPVIAAVIATGLVGPAIAALDRPVRSMPAARSQPGSVATANGGAPCPPVPEAGSRAGGWFRLDPVVDAGGALTGQRLTAGPLGAGPVASLELDAESFATGPVQGMVLTGTDDGERSRLRVIDASSGCVTAELETEGLVRRALLDEPRDAVIEHRLDRRTRTDLGIWRRPLSGGNGSRIAEPLAAIDRLGVIWSTELAWSIERDRIVVTSCGQAACLVRVINVVDGSVETIDEPAIGEAIGLSGSTLVAYGGCPALPCDVVGRDLESGRTRVIAERVGLAALGMNRAEPELVFEDFSKGAGIGVVGLGGSRGGTIADLGGLRLVPGPHRAGGAIEAPPGLMALGRDGRPPASGVDGRFFRLTDHRLIPAGEAIP